MISPVTNDQQALKAALKQTLTCSESQNQNGDDEWAHGFATGDDRGNRWDDKKDMGDSPNSAANTDSLSDKTSEMYFENSASVNMHLEATPFGVLLEIVQ